MSKSVAPTRRPQSNEGIAHYPENRNPEVHFSLCRMGLFVQNPDSNPLLIYTNSFLKMHRK